LFFIVFGILVFISFEKLVKVTIIVIITVIIFKDLFDEALTEPEPLSRLQLRHNLLFTTRSLNSSLVGEGFSDRICNLEASTSDDGTVEFSH